MPAVTAPKKGEILKYKYKKIAGSLHWKLYSTHEGNPR